MWDLQDGAREVGARGRGQVDDRGGHIIVVPSRRSGVAASTRSLVITSVAAVAEMVPAAIALTRMRGATSWAASSV